MTFAELKPGDRAKIVSYAGLPPAYRNRLLSLGLTPGTELLVQRRAPLGDPIQIRVRGFSLSVRGEEAAALEVESL